MTSTAPAGYDYVRDDKARCIRITIRRPLALDEALSAIDRQAHEQCWDYGVLCDVRCLPVPPSRADFDAIAARVFTYLVTEGSRGPVAFVTASPATVGAFQVYVEITARAGMNAQVFWDIDTAEEWLQRQVN